MGLYRTGKGGICKPVWTHWRSGSLWDKKILFASFFEHFWFFWLSGGPVPPYALLSDPLFNFLMIKLIKQLSKFKYLKCFLSHHAL
jgi:hypothetical protein